MSDYELCKMLEESGDPNETIKYVGESYLEGKNANDDAQLFLNLAISSAMVDTALSGGGFIPNCLKHLKKQKNKIFK